MEMLAALAKVRINTQAIGKTLIAHALFDWKMDQRAVTVTNTQSE